MTLSGASFFWDFWNFWDSWGSWVETDGFFPVVAEAAEPDGHPCADGEESAGPGRGGGVQNSARPSPLVSAMTGRDWAGRPSKRSGPAAAATAGAVSANQRRNRSAASR